MHHHFGHHGHHEQIVYAQQPGQFAVNQDDGSFYYTYESLPVGRGANRPINVK